MIRYPEIETLSNEEIQKYQLERINHILHNVRNTPFYKDRLPESISSFSDFAKLPFITKNDLRAAFPYELLSCEKSQIVKISASSGTTGIPTISYATTNDLQGYEENEKLHFSRAGLSENDIIQCMTGFNLFTAGWGCSAGAIGLGATLIPTGPGNTQRQIDFLKKLKANYLFSNPSYLQHLLEVIPEEDWKEIELKIAITGGEVLTKEFQNIAKKKYGVEVYNFYGMTEFATHIASECSYHNGLHLNEQYLYAEIIDPETEQTLPDGEYGELVLTNLQREAMPLIRYRTHDMTRIIPEQCPCGRTHRRIETITHRMDDMLIINGVNVFPSQIEECIYKYLPVATNYLIHVINCKNGLKKLLIEIEMPDELLNNTGKLKQIEKLLIKTLKSYIVVSPKLKFHPQKTLANPEGKAKRVVFE